MKKRVIKKKLEDFIKDETGKVSKDKILKVGLATFSALGILSAFSTSGAQEHTSSLSHANAPGGALPTSPQETCVSAHSSHSSHMAHSNHSSIY